MKTVFGKSPFMRNMGAMLLVCAAQNAAAQMSAMRESIYSPSSVAVEVKPLPTALTVAPGTGALGLGIEGASNSQVATFADATFINSNLPTRLRQEGRDDNTPAVQRLQGYGADIGLRYYFTSAHVDSWYSQAQVGYAMEMSQWGYKDEQVNHSTRSILPGAEAGYRWIWTNNVLVRVGGGADANIVQENVTTPDTVDTAVTNDARDKLNGAALAAVVPRVDLGVGYTF